MILKPCPFCGKTEIIVLNANEIGELDCDSELWVDDPAHAAVCNFNKGGCGATGGYRKTVTEASETWNRRT